MRFNREVEYALMSLMAMSGEGILHSARGLSEEYQIPYELLSKVLQRLAANGIVDSVKGAHGGYRLKSRPQDITLGEVIDSVQGKKSVAVCLDDEQQCVQSAVCNIKGSIRQVQTMWDSMIHSMTLSEFSERHFASSAS